LKYWKISSINNALQTLLPKNSTSFLVNVASTMQEKGLLKMTVNNKIAAHS
jgi:hypothetical protein